MMIIWDDSIANISYNGDIFGFYLSYKFLSWYNLHMDYWHYYLGTA